MRDNSLLQILRGLSYGIETKLCFLPEGKLEPTSGHFVQDEELFYQPRLLSPDGLVPCEMVRSPFL